MWSIIINLNKSATASSCVCAMLKQFLMYFHTKTKSLRLRFAIAKERRKEIWQQWRILVTLVQQNLESMFCSLFHISSTIRDFASPVRSLSLTMQAWALVMLSIMFLELQFPETNNPSLAYHHWEQRVDKKSQAHVKCMKFSSTNHQNGKQTTHMVGGLLKKFHKLLAYFIITHVFAIVCNFMHNEQSAVVLDDQRISFTKLACICIW